MSRPLRSRLLTLCLAATLAASPLAACGDDDSGSATTAADGATTTTAAASAAPTIEGAWARTSPAMASAGAAYFTVTSPGDDTLTAVKVDSSVAKMAQIHETVMEGGAMKMQELAAGLPLPAGQKVELKPGGYHVMLMELAQPLAVGSSIDLTLVFANAGEQTISVPVRDGSGG
jgi:copper(I)-binding protein